VINYQPHEVCFGAMPQDTPRYRQIAAELRSAIGQGEYPPGARLPGENALMQEYGVARMTARQALAVLISEGLAVSRKGAGVFVRTFRPIIRNGITRLASERWASGESIWTADIEDRSLTVDQIRVGEAAPPDRVAFALELEPPETVIQRSRRFVLDGKPVLLSVSYLPSKIAKGTPIAQENTGPGGIYARLRDLGHAPARFREDLRARMPSEAEAAQLALDPATPVVDITRIAYSEVGGPVELNEMTADGASYIFRYSFDG
jgi:GntR family transcriptional regulator